MNVPLPQRRFLWFDATPTPFPSIRLFVSGISCQCRNKEAANSLGAGSCTHTQHENGKQHLNAGRRVKRNHFHGIFILINYDKIVSLVSRKFTPYFSETFKILKIMNRAKWMCQSNRRACTWSAPGWPGIVYRSLHPSSMSEILAPVAIYHRHRHRHRQHQQQQQQQHHDLFIIIHELYEI